MNRLPPISTIMSPPMDGFANAALPATVSSCTTNGVWPSPPFSPESTKQQQQQPQQSLLHHQHPQHPQHLQHQQEHLPSRKQLSSDGSAEDPVLFPETENDVATDISSTLPLFGVCPQKQDSTDAAAAAADAAATELHRHIDMHMAQFTAKLNKPTKEEYLLALSCVPIVSKQYNKNPGAWLKREREYLDRQLTSANAIRTSAPVLKKLAPAPTTSTSMTTQLPSTRRVNAAGRTSNRIAKSLRYARQPKSIARAASKPFGSSTSPTGVSATTKKAVEALDLTASPPPKTRIGANRDHTSFDTIVDYSPPLTTLGDNVNALKVEWKGGSLDLSTDSLRNYLHPAELKLASILRLDCNAYLCNKRWIFKERVEMLRRGIEKFSKTNAQQACKVDVNKASRLFIAFEKVGWFDRHFFEAQL